MIWLYLVLLAAAVVLATVNILLTLRQGEPEAPLRAIEGLEKNQSRLEQLLREEVSRNREELNSTVRQNREELSTSMRGVSETVAKGLSDFTGRQREQLESFARQLIAFAASTKDDIEKVRSSVEMKLEAASHHSAAELEQIRKAVEHKLAETSTAVSSALELSSRTSREVGEHLRTTVDAKLAAIQQDNSAKLEQMRATVEEKLQSTLEQRLSESFALVSDRLEQVHRGLGEMQALASGVGDLKKVLSNIKTRGNWGEVQLGALLSQMLTPDQYASNVQTNPESLERVEFAIKLPGREGNGTVWLPIDSKFPQEDYQRLIEASEKGDSVAVSAYADSLEQTVYAEARKIREKYVNPPHTTDFAILFVPTEALFAELLRRPSACDRLFAERIVLAGPTTLAALLSSLQMGFKTLAIEKRSGEVWSVLGAVKTEFARFGEALTQVEKKLSEASTKIGAVQTRSRALQKRLRDVEALPGAEPATVLQLAPIVIAASADTEGDSESDENELDATDIAADIKEESNGNGRLQPESDDLLPKTNGLFDGTN